MNTESRASFPCVVRVLCVCVCVAYLWCGRATSMHQRMRHGAISAGTVGWTYTSDRYCITEKHADSKGGGWGGGGHFVWECHHRC